MKQTNEDELYILVDKAVDIAMTEHKFLFKMDSYLR